MSNDDAKERFFDALDTFTKLDKSARSSSSKIDDKSFKKVIIDLDAAIPGLEGANLGRAILLKALSLYWIYYKGLSKKNIFEIINNPIEKDPILMESHELSLKGKSILVKSNAPDNDIKWADDLIRKTTQ